MGAGVGGGAGQPPPVPTTRITLVNLDRDLESLLGSIWNRFIVEREREREREEGRRINK